MSLDQAFIHGKGFMSYASHETGTAYIPQHPVLHDPVLELRAEVVGHVGGEHLEELGLDRVEDDLLGVLRRLEQRVVAPPTRLGGVQEEAPQGVHVLVGERGDGENLKVHDFPV